MQASGLTNDIADVHIGELENPEVAGHVSLD